MTLSISSLFAESISTAARLPAARISRHTSYPLFPGIITSRMARSNGSAAPKAEAAADFAFCGATASVRRYRLERGGRSAALTEIEMKLARLFAAHPGEVLARDRVLNDVWGVNYLGTTRTLDQHVANLRRKVVEVGGDASALRTIHGVGYGYAEAPTPRVHT